MRLDIVQLGVSLVPTKEDGPQEFGGKVKALEVGSGIKCRLKMRS